MRKRLVFSVLAVVWMCLIFAYSHRPGTESQEDSCGMGLLFGRIVISDFEEWPEEDQLAFAMKVDHPIRKLAHFTEYLILAIFLVGALDNSLRRRILRLIIPWAVAAFYAVTDELHQFFIPGRNCNVGDVLIDSAGAFVGVLLSILVVDAVGRRRNNLIDMN